MAAGPRDTPQGRDAAADPDGSRETRRSHEPHSASRAELSAEPVDDDGGGAGGLEPFEPLGPLERLEPLESLDGLRPLTPLSLESGDGFGSGDGDPLDPDGALPPIGDGTSFRELRPQRRLQIWQLVPITALAVGGSLMFAFPLAFESGDAGPVVAMLGLLLCLCAAGWGLMAARRVGQTWPGLPPRGSGERPDWRYVAGYSAVIAVLAVLAVWRVARLR